MKCACYLLHTPKRAYKPPEDVCASHCSPASYSFFWRCQPENAPLQNLAIAGTLQKAARQSCLTLTSTPVCAQLKLPECIHARCLGRCSLWRWRGARGVQAWWDPPRTFWTSSPRSYTMRCSAASPSACRSAPLPPEAFNRQTPMCLDVLRSFQLMENLG